MKKIIFFAIIIATTMNVFSQQVENIPFTKSDYLQKNKKLKTVVFVCLGITATCVALVATGSSSQEVLPVLVLSGLTSVIISIPSFIIAKIDKINYKKSMRLFLKNESVFQIHNSSMFKSYIPSLNLKISI